MHLFNDSLAQITFTPDHKQLYLKWLCEPSETDLIRIYANAIDFAKSLQAHSMVVDNRIGFTVTMAMQRNLASLAISQLQEVQVRKFARITPPDVFQEIITHKVLDQVNVLAKNPIEVAYFHNLDDALAWTALSPAYEENIQTEL